MPVQAIFEGEISPAQYKQVKDQVAPNNVAPAGMLYHTAGASDKGWFVCETWESRETLDRFFHDTLGQALKDAKIDIKPRIFEIANTMQAKAS
jgi:hypothetical protein